MNTTKKRTQTIRATTTEKLQRKVQDMIRQGWEPTGDIQVDISTGEVIQTITKDK